MFTCYCLLLMLPLMISWSTCITCNVLVFVYKVIIPGQFIAQCTVVVYQEDTDECKCKLTYQLVTVNRLILMRLRIGRQVVGIRLTGFNWPTFDHGQPLTMKFLTLLNTLNSQAHHLKVGLKCPPPPLLTVIKLVTCLCRCTVHITCVRFLVLTWIVEA